MSETSLTLFLISIPSLLAFIFKPVAVEDVLKTLRRSFKVNYLFLPWFPVRYYSCRLTPLFRFQYSLFTHFIESLNGTFETSLNTRLHKEVKEICVVREGLEGREG